MSGFDIDDDEVVAWPELGQTGDLELRIPPDPAFIRVVRLATSGLASMAGFDLDGIEDLKIAIDEVCSTLIELGDGTPIDLQLTRVEPCGLCIEGTVAMGADAKADADRVALGDRILEVIADRHELSTSGGQARFRVIRYADLSGGATEDSDDDGA